mgnify:FL=1
MFLKKLNRLLTVAILIISFIAILIKVREYRITNYESNFYKILNNLASDKNTKKFNFETIRNTNENDVVVVNIFSLNSPSFSNNLNISRYLLAKFKNVGVYNIIIEEDDEKSNLDLSKLIGDDADEIIYKYNINEPTIYVSKDILDGDKFLKDNLNKIIILDKMYNKRCLLDGNIGIDDIIGKVEEATQKKVHFNKKNVNNGNGEKKVNKDGFIYKNMTKIISLENFNGKSMQMFAILDTNTKNILIIKPDGEIKQIIDCKNFCSPSNIKYLDDKLYVTDSCNGSIEYFDFKDKKLKLLVKNQNLVGISDFEFMNGGYILVSKMNPNDSIGIFSNNVYTSILDLSEDNNGLVVIPKIGKFNDKYYYFDANIRTLYSFDGSKSSVVIQLDDEYSTKIINNFYVNSDNDIYFLYENSNYVLRYYNETFSEQPVGDYLFSINDFLISKNLFFKLSDNVLEIIDIYHKVNSKIEPFIDRNTENFGDLTEHVHLYSDLNFCGMDNIEKNSYNFVGIDKNAILEPSFLMLFFEKDAKLVLDRIIHRADMYGNMSISDGIFGKIYYKDDFGNFRVRYVNCKVVAGSD